MSAFDPHPSLQDLIRRFHEAEAKRPADRPIRIHRAVVMASDAWRHTVQPNVSNLGTIRPRRTGIVRDHQRLADIGDALGVPVGRIVEATP